MTGRIPVKAAPMAAPLPASPAIAPPIAPRAAPLAAPWTTCPWFCGLDGGGAGPAAGGCRRWTYASDDLALTDVLRLSRGMTYKNAVAGLPFGGGKSVILAGEHAPKSTALFEAFGRAIDSLQGRYITAEDVGISVDDMRIVRGETPFVSGLPQSGAAAGGDPSPWTALGVFHGIEAAAAARLGSESLEGVTVAVQGVGSVGYHLAKELHELGAKARRKTTHSRASASRCGVVSRS